MTAPEHRGPGPSAGAFSRHRRRLLADRMASGIIGMGGISVVLAILLIFVFVGREALPLLTGSRFGAAVQLPAASGEALLVGTDAYQDLVWTLDASGSVHVADRALGGQHRLQLPLDSLETLTAVAPEGGQRSDRFAVGTSTGRVWLASLQATRELDGPRPHSVPSLEQEGPLTGLDTLRQASSAGLRQLAFARGESAGVVAWVAEDRLQVLLEDRDLGLWTPLAPPAGLDLLPVALAASPSGDRLALMDAQGEVVLLEVGADGLHVSMRQRFAMLKDPRRLAFLTGSKRLVLGDSQGTLLSLMEIQGKDGNEWVASAPLSSHRAPITQILSGPRDRTVLTADQQGVVRLHYATTGRLLLESRMDFHSLAFSPRGDALVHAAPGDLGAVELRNAHPEISWRALFGRVQYEGYAAPEAVWQSTGGSDDFEPKFSLLPLLFGTLKGTLFALIISVPLALLGAIYISQFAPTWLARQVKPAIEIMAALPSVIIGFLAGLVFAPWLEGHLTLVLAFAVLLPLLILAMVPIWQRLPGHKLGPKGLPQLAQGLVLTLAAFAAAWALAPWLDASLFGGSLIQWLQEKGGIVYDQRNSLVVGFALGFAVIPIIFTMAEDALSNVPEALVNASLALGASRWTTVARVVLPAAAAGVFAAIMIGLGRAIGETMIVLMATGNTPLLDLSPLNGFRAMSACIAVEIPEAPLGGTLYRLLFLTALLLFLFTFAINSVAAWIGERLRKSHGRL